MSTSGDDPVLGSAGDVSTVSRPRRGLLVVGLRGDLDMATVPRVRERLRQLASGSDDRLVLDLSGVSFLASSGVRLIVSAREETGARDLHLVGVRDNRPVRRVLEITGSDAEFLLHETVADVVRFLADC